MNAVTGATEDREGIRTLTSRSARFLNEGRFAEIDFSDGGDRADVLSGFAVFRTDIDGRTEVYAVGNYADTLRRTDDGWRIATRRVIVETRMFRTPTPTPL